MRDVPGTSRAPSEARAYMPSGSGHGVFRSRREEISDMTFHEQAVVHETIVPERAASLSSSIKSAAESFAAWVQSCAELEADAALYDALRKLSDSELQKRGLSRDTLARDISRVGGAGARPTRSIDAS